MISNIEAHGHHISKQFNLELEEIKNNMLEMGGVIERQIADAMRSLLEGDTGLAAQVLTVEDRIDSMEINIDEECSLILARRHPAASDLRLVLAIIKAVRDLERIGDESAKIARMAIKLSEEGEFSQGLVEFRHLADSVTRMVSGSLDAFARYDADAALEVVRDDVAVDKVYASVMRSLITYMMEDPRSISRVLNMLWALRALERIGDHAKNVAEHVIYLVKGMDVRHEKLADVEEQLED
ncbi:MAG: phosphate signaling complex protein PhoU [Proteobacteria bacterium]|jgi:phosphate transport system protein|nr:phosphate signaling complex protein PhoU [Pseudomonadota bacterium]MDA0897010.1 phosphate signaling complex protein PhoU [Pseudomonadota bacterium]MDA1244216.1 phosphate signaling complex protein PhoU [Pseudomonadota bacterium]